MGLAAMGGGMPAVAGEVTDEDRAELAQYFGFGDLQIYKIEPATSQLRLRDLNGDGKTDVCIWNAYKNRFELFYQRGEGEAPTSAGGRKLERNQVADRGTMRRETIPVAYNVSSADVADVTGDGLPDIIFFGEPKELVVIPATADGKFAAATSTRAPEGNARSGSLAIGDFNNDKRTDVALLGSEYVLVYHQKPGGGLDQPEKILHTIPNAVMMLAADVDGDGRDDLCISADDEQYAVYVMFQQTSNRLGPIQRVKVPNLRSMTFAAGQNQAADLYAVEHVSNRLIHYRWGTPPRLGAGSEWPQRYHTFPVTTKAKRQPFAVGEITGDGLSDCITATADGAQLILLEQGPGGLLPARTFPGMLKTSTLDIVDLDGDGKNELLCVSAEERLIAVSKYDGSRLTFPSAIPSRGKPLAAAAGSLRASGRVDTLAYVTRQDKTAHLIVRPLDADDDQAQVVDIESLPDDPAGIRFHDVDQDGRPDLLVFVRFNALQVFLQSEDGKFTPFKGGQTREGLVREAPLEGADFYDVDGDGKLELILAQKSFARAFRIRDGRWEVVEQFNPDRADAELAGLTAMPAESGSRPRLAMYDRKSKEVIVLSPTAEQSYEMVMRMPVGSVDPIAMATLRGGSDGAMEVLLADVNKIIALTPTEAAPTLIAVQSYETDVERAWLADAVVGDLNQDGVRDVAVVDMRKANIEILTTLPDGKLVRATRFQVFQGKRFSDSPEGGAEPHEVQIADLTGDVRHDIAALVHDRLVIYPSQ
jgi:hypothetical protein